MAASRRPEERRDLQDDQEEAGAVLQDADLALARALARADRNVRDGEPGLEAAQRDRRRVRKRVRQQVQELHKGLFTSGPETGGEVRDLVARHYGGEQVQKLVSQAAIHAGVCIRTSCTDHEIISILDFIQQSRYIAIIVLSIRIHENDHLTRCMPGTGLDSGTISQVIQVAHHRRACICSDERRFIL